MYRQLKECRDQDAWWVERQQEILQQRIDRVRSTIKISPPVEYQHLKINYKKKEAEREKQKDIERTNETIKSRVHYIATRKAIVETNHYTVKSLLDTHQRKESERIYKENVGLVKRLQNQKSPYDRFQAEREYQQAMYYARNRSMYGPAVRYHRPVKPRKLEPLVDAHEVLDEQGTAHTEQNDTQTSARWASSAPRNPAPPSQKPAITRKSPRTVKIENDNIYLTATLDDDSEVPHESDRDSLLSDQNHEPEANGDSNVESSGDEESLSDTDVAISRGKVKAEKGNESDSEDHETEDADETSDDDEEDSPQPNLLQPKTSLRDREDDSEGSNEAKSRPISSEAKIIDGDDSVDESTDGSDDENEGACEPNFSGLEAEKSEGMDAFDDDLVLRKDIIGVGETAQRREEDELGEEQENLALTKTSEQHIQTLSPDEMIEMMGTNGSNRSLSSRAQSRQASIEKEVAKEKIQIVTKDEAAVRDGENVDVLNLVTQENSHDDDEDEDGDDHDENSESQQATNATEFQDGPVLNTDPMLGHELSARDDGNVNEISDNPFNGNGASEQILDVHNRVPTKLDEGLDDDWSQNYEGEGHADEVSSECKDSDTNPGENDTGDVDLTPDTRTGSADMNSVGEGDKESLDDRDAIPQGQISDGNVGVPPLAPGASDLDGKLAEPKADSHEEA